MLSSSSLQQVWFWMSSILVQIIAGVPLTSTLLIPFFTGLTLERLGFFATSKVGGRGVDSTANLATSRSGNLMHSKVGHSLVNSPMTKMTILNGYKLFLSQSADSVNFRGLGNALDRKIHILSDFRFSGFWPNFRFSYFFSESLSKINQKG